MKREAHLFNSEIILALIFMPLLGLLALFFRNKALQFYNDKDIELANKYFLKTKITFIITLVIGATVFTLALLKVIG